MPTYVYKREDGSTFEIIQKMSDRPLTKCPTTGQTVKRVITGGGGVVYKGDGWYVTDYKDRGKPAEKNQTASAGNSNGKADTEKTSETTSKSKENKAAAK